LLFGGGWGNNGWSNQWNNSYGGTYPTNRGPDNDNSQPVQLPPNANNVQPTEPAKSTDVPNNSPTAAAAQAANAVQRSPQLAAADAAVQRAQADYDAAKQRVLDSLRGQSQYQQALARRQQAEQQVSALRQGGAAASAAEVAPAAQAKLDAGDEVTRMEAAALAADPAAADAKNRLQDAVAKRDALRKELIAQHQRGG